MGNLRALVLAVACLTGCGAYVHGGYDASWTVKGPLAGVVSQSAGASTNAKAAETSVVGSSYSGGLGFGVRNFQVELGVHSHDVSGGTFSLPDPATNTVPASSPRYLTASASLEARWVWLRISRLSVNLHGGPVHAVVFDRTGGGATWGDGYRYGTGLELSLGPVTGYVDMYRSEIAFSEGPALGWSDLRGVTVGAMLRQ
jgi:hypothetical protein